jgi:hypothetical protein
MAVCAVERSIRQYVRTAWTVLLEFRYEGNLCVVSFILKPLTCSKIGQLVCARTAVGRRLDAASQRMFSLFRENYLLELEPNFSWEADYKENGLKHLDTRSLLLRMFCTNRLLVAFEKLRSETFSFVVCVCPSAWNGWAPSERIVMKFRIWIFFFRKSVEKIQVSLKFDKSNGYLHEDLCEVLIISRVVIPRMRSVSHKIKLYIFNDFFHKSFRL